MHKQQLKYQSVVTLTQCSINANQRVSQSLLSVKPNTSRFLYIFFTLPVLLEHDLALSQQFWIEFPCYIKGEIPTFLDSCRVQLKYFPSWNFCRTESAGLLLLPDGNLGMAPFLIAVFLLISLNTLVFAITVVSQVSSVESIQVIQLVSVSALSQASTRPEQGGVTSGVRECRTRLCALEIEVTLSVLSEERVVIPQADKIGSVGSEFETLGVDVWRCQPVTRGKSEG